MTFNFLNKHEYFFIFKGIFLYIFSLIDVCFNLMLKNSWWPLILLILYFQIANERKNMFNIENKEKRKEKLRKYYLF